MAKQSTPAHRGIGWAEVEQLGVDAQGRLTWKGDLVQVQKRVTLSLRQKVGAVVIALGAASQGMLAVYQFGCAMAFWTKGCSR